jgi:hypothetical protein
MLLTSLERATYNFRHIGRSVDGDCSTADQHRVQGLGSRQRALLSPRR